MVRAVAPWVRTRLRTAPVPAVALFVLVGITAFLCAAFPRAVDAYEGEGLRHELGVAVADQSALRFTAAPEPAYDPADPALRKAVSPREMTERQRRIVRTLPEPLRADPRESSYGVRTQRPMRGQAPGLTELDGGTPAFTLAAPAGLAEHAAVRSGRLPKPRAAAPYDPAAEAVVTSATAKALGIRVGTVVRVPRGGGEPLAVAVTGIVEPVRPAGSYWSVQPVLRTPTLLYTDGMPPAPYWHGTLLLAPEAAPALLALENEAEPYWDVAVDPGGFGAHDLDAARRAVAAVENGPVLSELREAVSPELQVISGLAEIFEEYAKLRGAIGPVVSVAAFGVGGVIGVVLLTAGGLAASRRRSELALLRARGGSMPGTAGRLLAEVAVPAVPAAVAGGTLAVLLVPEGRLWPAVLATVLVTVVACVALPLRAVLAHRRPRPSGGRDDVVRARPSRRRTVAELTLLVLAVAAVVAVRRRGTADGAEQGVDQLVSAAPVLLGVVAALALVRLYPLPLRLVARPVARRRGAIGFLALTRAGRAPATTVLPLLALLLALVTTAFGGSVLAGVEGARDRAAVLSVGADARVESAGALPKGLAETVRKLPGVTGVVEVYRETDLSLRDGDDAHGVTLLAAEPAAYARLARSTGLGGFPAKSLRRPDAGPLPVIVSPGAAERLGSGPRTIGPLSAALTVRVAAVRELTPGLSEGDFVLVDAAALTGPKAATTLLVSGGSVAGGPLRAAVREADRAQEARVALRSEERAAFAESPVQTGAERVYAVAVAAAAGYAVLALLLSLLQAAPERIALLARLRTMGLTRRQGRRLLVLENLPGSVLAGAGGVLVGWAVVLVLSPGVDLSRLAHASGGTALSRVPVELTVDAWSLLLPGAGVVVLAAGVAAVQAWLTTRRSSTTELRVGDSR
ncbi:FtsX-like permease family protein [Streptomyces qinzhouensis]|uniref:FtsX-like permease family protein n=1 Tax=Streptomyces qinzhouensis TaxID=2599401 RepID=UPI001FE75063|nr:FtsX-like permease family protein [Streptomyces qinzhouensis]